MPTRNVTVADQLPPPDSRSVTKNQAVRTITSTSSGNAEQGERDQRRGERQQRQGQPCEIEAAERRAIVEPACPGEEGADEAGEERDHDHRR